MKIFILTAGLGIRLKPLTDKKPKCLIKIGGRPIIDHIFINLCQHRPTLTPMIVGVNLHHLPLLIIDYLRSSVHYFSEPKLLGTAGALKNAENWLNTETDFFVINSDTISDVNLTEMYRLHKSTGDIATIFTHDNAIHCGGTYLFRRDILNYIPANKAYSIHEDLIPDLIRKRIPITLYKSSAYYFDISTLKKLKKARRCFNVKEKPSNLS